MGKTSRPRFSDEFRHEAVHLLKTSGLTIEQLADDLGVGKSTLSKWKRQIGEGDLLAGPHEDMETELRRLKKENELLRQERDILKKATAFFAKETSR